MVVEKNTRRKDELAAGYFVIHKQIQLLTATHD